MNRASQWVIRASQWGRAWQVCVMAVGAIVLAGCATKIKPSENWPAPLEPATVLQPGDGVSLKFVHWPELDTKQTIRPDGKVSLLLVGDYEIAGKTPDAVAAELKDVQYKDKLKFRNEEHEIQVVVDSFDSRRIFVGGEVRAPGLQPLGNHTTILEAIMAAGGPLKESADLRKVTIVRQRDGKQFAQTINVKEMTKSQESEWFVLEPRDVVIVPRTGIDRVDQWVEQYVNKIIPRSVYFNLTHPIGDSGSVSSDNTSFTFPVATAP